MIILTAPAKRPDRKTGLPIVHYIVCESMIQASSYLDWILDGSSGCCMHHLQDLRELREKISSHYGFEEFELAEITGPFAERGTGNEDE